MYFLKRLLSLLKKRKFTLANKKLDTNFNFFYSRNGFLVQHHKFRATPLFG